MKKRLVIMVSAIILIIFSLLLFAKISIDDTKAELRAKAEKYIKEKYNEDMIIYEVSLSDIKVARAYPKEKPELKFNIFIYVEPNDNVHYNDYYIAECLKKEAKNIISSAISSYTAEVYISDLKWCNPTPDGKNETYYYLDVLYEKLGRIPCWADINEHQKIENVKVTIKDRKPSANDVLQIKKLIAETECNIENIEITG